jgi:FkbM family methyltransferase
MSDIYDFLNELENKLENNLAIIECGGHLGSDTEKLCKLFKNSTIYCIEANFKLYNNLKNLKYDNLKLFNCCLSNKTGETDFYIDLNPEGDSGASSILQSTDNYLNNYIKIEDKVIVKSITLFDFMKNNNLDKIFFLWLDVEGFEYYILNSSIDVLNKINYIYTEVNFQEFRKDTKLYNDIKSLLLENNFIELKKWEQGAEWGSWQGNVLFKNLNY